jgi:hypothetical protein
MKKAEFKFNVLEDNWETSNNRVSARDKRCIRGKRGFRPYAAEIQLLDLVESDRTLHGIMQKHGATRADFLRCGAGQWSRGHWVAASALCYGSTLEFVLTKLREGEVTGGNPERDLATCRISAS